MKSILCIFLTLWALLASNAIPLGMRTAMWFVGPQTSYCRVSVVEFNANGGKVVGEDGLAHDRIVRDVDFESELGALPGATRSGYKLAGWYTAKSGGTKASASTIITNDVVYYAHWSAAWTVTFNANGGAIEDGGLGTSRPTMKVAVAKNNPVGALPTPKRTGYSFAGWYLHLQSLPSCSPFCPVVPFPSLHPDDEH